MDHGVNNSPDEQAESRLIALARGPAEKAEDSGSEKGGDEADCILADFTSAFDAQEERGPPVADSLAEVLKGRFGKKLEDSKLKAKLAKYAIPENCSALGVPRTNQEVFLRTQALCSTSCYTAKQYSVDNFQSCGGNH